MFWCARMALAASLFCEVTAASPATANEDSDYVYKTAFSWLPLYDEIRFNKAKNTFETFENDREATWGEGERIGGYYREDIDQELAVAIPFLISVPLNIKDGMKWSYKAWQCDAKLKFGLYYVLCFTGTQSLTRDSKTSLYVYSKERGIMAFSNQCAVNTKCWFELSSPKGLLRDLHR